MPLSGSAIEQMVRQAARVAMNGAADRVKDDANSRIGNVSGIEDPTPELSLEDSVTKRSTSTGPGITVTLRWGKGGGGWHGLGTMGYAIVQHERTDFQHPRGGEPKYASNAIKASVPWLAGEVAARIRAVL
jgi:hypothetical protein